MKCNTIAINKYALFGSKLRGEAYVERYLEQLLSEMETYSNLQNMAHQLKKEWMDQHQGVAVLADTFGGMLLKPSIDTRQGAKAKPRLLNRRATKLSKRKVSALWE